MAGNYGPILRETESQEILYKFLPSFRVEGLPKSRSVPTAIIDGRDGEFVQPSLIRENAREISIVGELYAAGGTKSERRASIEEELDNIMLPISEKQEVWLCRGEEDERFISCYYVSVDHNYIESAGRTIATCRFRFTGFTPHWYSLINTEYTGRADWSDLPVILLQLTNDGNDSIESLIQIHGPAVNPSITNMETGQEIQYTGTIKTDETLIINCQQIKVRLIGIDIPTQSFLKSTFPVYQIADNIGTNVLANMNAEFLIHGFEMLPGLNRLNIDECIIDSGLAQTGTADTITLASTASDNASILSGTAQAAGAYSITLASDASEEDDYYNNCYVEITGGTGSGQTRQITDYYGSTKVATVAIWDTQPNNASTYDILYNGYYNDCYVEITSGTGAGQIRQITDYNSGTEVATVDTFWNTNPDNTSNYRILNLEISMNYRERWL